MSEITVTPSGMQTTTKVAPVTAQSIPAPQAEPAIETAPPESISKPASPELEALVKNTKANREAQRRAQEERTKWEQERQNYVDFDSIKTNPLEVLAKAGVTYDQLTQAAINSVDPIQNKFQTIEQKLAQIDNFNKSQEERARQAESDTFDRARKQIKYEASIIANDPAYEIVKHYGDEAFDRVAEIITDKYNETQQLLSVEDAVKQVEDEYTTELKRLASLGKLKSLFEGVTAQNVDSAQPPVSAQTSNNTQARTLTNAMAQVAPVRRTEKERKARAIRVAMGLSPD